MATEASTPQTDAAVPTEEKAAPAVGEQKPQRERRQHTPPEELYDLTQPIPRVRDPHFLREMVHMVQTTEQY